MIYSREALAKHRLERSQEVLKDAQLLLKGGSSSGALLMALRAAKEAAEAALLASGNESVKSESLLFLTSGFVRDGRLSKDSFNAFRTLMDLSQYANECDFIAVKHSEAGAAVENLKYFMREMGDIVKD
jgi:uncharacterized protein (UPF0332 family)